MPKSPVSTTPFPLLHRAFLSATCFIINPFHLSLRQGKKPTPRRKFRIYYRLNSDAPFSPNIRDYTASQGSIRSNQFTGIVATLLRSRFHYKKQWKLNANFIHRHTSPLFNKSSGEKSNGWIIIKSHYQYQGRFIKRRYGMPVWRIYELCHSLQLMECSAGVVKELAGNYYHSKFRGEYSKSSLRNLIQSYQIQMQYQHFWYVGDLDQTISNGYYFLCHGEESNWTAMPGKNLMDNCRPNHLKMENPNTYEIAKWNAMKLSLMLIGHSQCKKAIKIYAEWLRENLTEPNWFQHPSWKSLNFLNRNQCLNKF